MADVIFEYEPDNGLGFDWTDSKKIREIHRNLEHWYVKMAEELMVGATNKEKAAKIGFHLHKYIKIKMIIRNNGGL